MQNTFFLTTFLLCFLNSNLLFSQPFELDISFGENGKINIPSFKWTIYEQNKLAIQKDDKMLVLLDDTFQAIRYDKEGKIDTSFGENGISPIALIDGQYDNIFPNKIAIQSDGKIILLGTVDDNPEGFTLVIRLCEDGTIDKKFGDNGMVIIELETFNTTLNSIVFQDNRKIVLAGHSLSKDNNILADRDFMLARLNESGDLDREFGNGGIVLIDSESRGEFYRDLELRANGKIIAAGFVENERRNHDFIINQFNIDGSLDTTFGTKGQTMIDISGGNDEVQYIELLENGKILIGGWAENRLKADAALMRCHSNGIIDSTFGNNGIVLTDLSGSDNVVFQSHDFPTAFLRNANGKLLVSINSYVSNFNDTESFLVQYNENGLLDEDFGTGGIFRLDYPSNISIQGLAYQSNEKLIITENESIENEEFYYLARYVSDLNVGTIDFATKLNNALVYPNPLQEETILEYTLENPETLTIQLTDLNGRILKTYLQNQLQKAGLRLASGNGQFAIKVVK